MAKVSIALRGWRFEEDDVFDENGEMRDLDEIPEDALYRLIRLRSLIGEPCSACWLVHGEENADRCNTADIVYGEPLAEVVLCDEHEADFLYWFREEGGEQYTGRAALQDEFHEWFADGNRAPDWYEGLEHVEEDPEAVPDISETERLEELDEQVESMDDEEKEALDVDLDGLDV